MIGLGLHQEPDSFKEAADCFERGDLIRAVKLLIDVLKADSTYHPAYDLLGDIYFSKSQGFPAIENYAQAVAYDPDNIEYAQKLVKTVSGLVFKKVNQNLKGVLTACLQSNDIQFTHFGKAWLSMIKLDPVFSQYYKFAKSGQYSSFKKGMDGLGSYDGLLDVFFLSGLGRFIVPDPEFEHWVSCLRRYLLDAVLEDKSLFSDEEGMEFLTSAVSRYCFFTDYIFSVSEEERRKIDALEKDISQSKDFCLFKIACLGCYKPLYRLDNAKDIEVTLKGGDHVSQISKSQIYDYFEQQQIKQTIHKFTDIKNQTSLAVQDQYEQFPYPRWQVAAKDLFHPEYEGHLKGKKARILVAGCGTGQEAIQLAYVFPDADITAVDLSQTSLAYAISKANTLGLNNISFGQGDIMNLDQLDQKFDYIASSGVLHHMEDPKAGWAVLNGLLADNGLMRIALYSRKARWAINDARDYIEKNNIGSDAQSIKEFRVSIRDHVKHKSLKNIFDFYDYYSLSECRDLLFHACEHQYDLLDIKQILDEFSLEFRGFYLGHKTLEKYKRQNKSDEKAVDLKLWDKFEAKNPDTFAAMYTFWCQKV